MNTDEIIVNGKTIGKIFVIKDNQIEVWISHCLVMDVMEKQTGKKPLYTH